MGAVLVFVPLTRFLWDPWSQQFLFLFVLAVFLVRSPQLLLIKKKIVLPDLEISLVLFIFFFAASSLGSPFKELARNQSLVLFSTLFLYWTVRQMGQESKELLKKTVCGTVCVISLLFLLTFLSQNEHLRSRQAPEFFLNDNFFSSFMLIGIFVSLDLFRRSRALSAATLLLACLAFFKAQSFAGFLGIAGAFIFIFLKERKGPEPRIDPKWFLAGAAAALSTGFYVYLRNPWMKISPFHRIKWWTYANQMALDRPFLGSGPGSFEKMLHFYSAPGINSIYAHSFPLQTAAELGLPAALLLLVFFAGRIAKMESRYLAGGSIAVLLQSLFDFPLNVPGMFLIFFVILGLASLRKEGFELEPSRKNFLLASFLLMPPSFFLAWRAGLEPLWAFQESLKAEDSFDKMDLASAEGFLRQSIKRDPLPAKVYQRLAQVLLIRYEKENRDKNFLDEAVTFQKEAVRREMTSIEYRNQMALLLELSGFPLNKDK